MSRVLVRGFLSRKLRSILSGIAIALGVALMAGTYILTDTINQSFATIFATGAAGRDVVVVPHQALGSGAMRGDLAEIGAAARSLSSKTSISAATASRRARKGLFLSFIASLTSGSTTLWDPIFGPTFTG